MKLFAGLVAIYLVVMITAIACRENEGSHYLKGNALMAPLELVELQGGVVGFTGKYYAIEPDGGWTVGLIIPGKGEKGAPTARGKLTREQLVQLAKHLHQHSLSTLTSHGAPEVNPRIVKIRFGQHVEVLNPKPGDTTKEEDLAIRNRYEGILSAVKSLCTTATSSD